MAGPDVVEFYLVRDGAYMKFEWEGPDPSFVLLAPLEGALHDLGIFDTDPVGAWPAEVGTPWFLVPAAAAAELADIFDETPWRDFLTPARIRDSLGVSDTHAGEMVELALVESARLTRLLHAAGDHGADLLCVVY